MIDEQPNMFAEEIQAMIDQLSSKSAADRREAALFLGEAAAAEAVPDLIDLYKKDKDASVRAAAAYALGMFKAIDRALAAGDEEKVTQYLRQVEEEGELGSRARTGRAVKIMVGLILSLAVIVVIYFNFQPKLKATLFGSTHTRATVVTDMRHSFDMVNNDTRTLQNALIGVISNQPLSCVAFFNNAPAYHLDAVDAVAYPDLATLGSRLSAIQTSLTKAKARYDAACNQGAAFGVAEARDTFSILTPALQQLVPLQADLAQAEAEVGGQPASIPPTSAPGNNQAAPTNAPANAAPTSAPANNNQAAPTQQGSLQPGVELQPTVPPPASNVDPKTQLAPLYNLLDDVTSTRGASTLLLQYWMDVKNTGSTSGCDLGSFPTVPNNIFIPEEYLQASTNLRDAVQLTNNGLAALRDGWQNFRNSCAQQSLTTDAPAGLANASVVANSFDAAKTLLDRVQNGG